MLSPSNPVTPMSRSWIPEIKSKATRIAPKITALPRSFPSITNNIMAKNVGTSTTITFDFEFFAASCFASIDPAQRIMKNLANSLGWKTTGPKAIQFRLPLTEFPIPGIWSSKSISNDPRKEKRAIILHNRTGIREESQPMGIAITRKMSWRKNMENEEPLVSNEWMDEADRTITSPKPVKAAVLTSRR